MSESSLDAKRELTQVTLSNVLPTVAEARATMLSGIAPLGDESVTLADALGRVLAGPVRASRDQPPFAISEMDGYALQAAETPGRLNLIGESAAGHGFTGAWAKGGAIRISTGAAIPNDADAVVIQEDVTRDGDALTVPEAKAGQYIRPRAMDFSAGTSLLPAGRRLDGVALALAAAAGAASLPVVRRPRITLLSGGDELVDPDATPGPFQIFDSGTHGIAALVRAWGGEAKRLQLQKDDVNAIARAAEQGLQDSDLLVLIGGASVGDHDHARPALQRLGLKLAVEKIQLRPGKPTWFGHAPQGAVLGLPGNPASALVCAHLFLRPLIEAMLGRDPDACVRFRRARLLEALPANGPREHYLRAQLGDDGNGQLTVRAFEQQDSSLLSVFASANALIRMRARGPAIPAATMVDVLPLDSVMSPAEWEILATSFSVAARALAWSLPFAIAMAYFLSRPGTPGRIILDGLTHLPVILPPVLVGFVLLIVFGRRGPVGSLLEQMFGIHLAFTTAGAALATGVMTFPLLVRSIRLAFEATDARLFEAAAMLRAGPWDRFATIALPLAGPGILAGAVTAFAAAMGEFGAVITFAANIPGRTQTLPLAIYAVLQEPGGEAQAWRLALISFSVAMCGLVAAEFLQRRARKRLAG